RRTDAVAPDRDRARAERTCFEEPSSVEPHVSLREPSGQGQVCRLRHYPVGWEEANRKSGVKRRKHLTLLTAPRLTIKKSGEDVMWRMNRFQWDFSSTAEIATGILLLVTVM